MIKNILLILFFSLLFILFRYREDITTGFKTGYEKGKQEAQMQRAQE